MLDPVTYKAKHEALENQIKHYAALRDTAKSDMDTYAKAETKYKGQIADLNAQVSTCKTQIKEFSAKKDSESKLLSKVERSAESFSATVSRLRRQVSPYAEFSQTVRFAQGRTRALDQALGGHDFVKTRAQVADAHTTVKKQIAKYKDKIDDLKDEQSSHNKKLDTAQADLKKAQDDYTSAKDKHSSYVSTIATLEAKLRALEAAQKA
jgi:chromosome segregation ATPase